MFGRLGTIDRGLGVWLGGSPGAAKSVFPVASLVRRAFCGIHSPCRGWDSANGPDEAFSVSSHAYLDLQCL